MLQGIPALTAARGAGSSLLSGLQVYYKLEDVTDSGPSNLTLTNHGTVTFSAGKVGNAANFVSSSSQYLSRADNAAFQMGTSTDFTMAAWVKFSVTGLAWLVCYGVAAFDIAGYSLRRAADGGITAAVSDGTNTVSLGDINLYNDGGWHLAVMTASRVGNLSLFIDNVSETTPLSIASVGNVNGGGDFEIGATLASQFLDGSVDEVGIWSRVLTGTEIGNLWNSGNGTTYPFTGL